VLFHPGAREMDPVEPREILFDDDADGADGCDGGEDEEGPLSPTLCGPSACSLASPRAAAVGQGARCDPVAAPEGPAPQRRRDVAREPLGERCPLSRRLHTMAMIHAKATAQLLQLQRHRHDVDMRALREDTNFELLELRQEVSLLQGECDALRRAFDSELAAWTSRAASAEARVSALHEERVELAAQVRLSRAAAAEAAAAHGRALAACEARGDEQVDQLSRLFLRSAAGARRGAPEDGCII
jgi:predicted GNAT family N-acyltransferase